MNPFLTPKASRSRPWAIPVALILGVLSVAAVFTAADCIVKQEWATAVAGLFLLTLFLLPAVRIVLGQYDRHHAYKIARLLAPIEEERISMARFGSTTSMRQPAQTLRRLIAKGYLQNMYVDSQKNEIVLTATLEHSVDDVCWDMKCPGCGSMNRVRPGRVTRCIYCDQLLTASSRSTKAGR